MVSCLCAFFERDVFSVWRFHSMCLTPFMYYSWHQLHSVFVQICLSLKGNLFFSHNSSALFPLCIKLFQEEGNLFQSSIMKENTVGLLKLANWWKWNEPHCTSNWSLILPVVLYGCEAWSLSLREECRLRVFIWKQDPEANIWAQEGWEWGVEKAPQWRT